MEGEKKSEVRHRRFPLFFAPDPQFFVHTSYSYGEKDMETAKKDEVGIDGSGLAVEYHWVKDPEGRPAICMCSLFRGNEEVALGYGILSLTPTVDEFGHPHRDNSDKRIGRKYAYERARKAYALKESTERIVTKARITMKECGMLPKKIGRARLRRFDIEYKYMSIYFPAAEGQTA